MRKENENFYDLIKQDELPEMPFYLEEKIMHSISSKPVYKSIEVMSLAHWLLVLFTCIYMFSSVYLLTYNFAIPTIKLLKNISLIFIIVETATIVSDYFNTHNKSKSLSF